MAAAAGSDVVGTSSQAVAAVRRVRGAVVGMVLGLLVQYAVGILVNLFAAVPLHHPGHDSANYFGGVVAVIPWAIGGGGALAVHAALGLLLVLDGAFIFIRALTLRRRALGWLTGLGVLFVLGAGFNGASFLEYNHDQSSLVMGWLFALALLCYILALVRIRPA
ncbi:MAG: hypothetical protein ACRDL8_07500 [Solirubrobacteraceae bacterium]